MYVVIFQTLKPAFLFSVLTIKNKNIAFKTNHLHFIFPKL